MLINGYDYKFAYTVGAFCDLTDLHLSPPKNIGEQRKAIMQMAVLLSNAYEEREKVRDPGYQMHKLTLQQVRALSLEEFDTILTPEVDAAVAAGSYRTVEAQPVKNQKGAVAKKSS